MRWLIVVIAVALGSATARPVSRGMEPREEISAKKLTLADKWRGPAGSATVSGKSLGAKPSKCSSFPRNPAESMRFSVKRGAFFCFFISNAKFTTFYSGRICPLLPLKLQYLCFLCFSLENRLFCFFPDN